MQKLKITLPSARGATVAMLVCAMLALAACGSAPRRGGGGGGSGGGYYQDDGPGRTPPPNLDRVADAQPRVEPLNATANTPYTVFGREYVPARTLKHYRARGIATWYGRKYNGQPTSIGETYNMYAMTAAHPTLPLPSYARVTNLANGRSVIVRVNDRGPFVSNRLIDLSYAAAYKLGFVELGSAQVEVEAIIPGSGATETAVAPAAPPVPADNTSVAPASFRAEGGVFLQLGAFAARQNAEWFRRRVSRELPNLGEPVVLRDGNGLTRVHVGPYPDEAAARAAAKRIRDAFDIQPVLVRPH